MKYSEMNTVKFKTFLFQVGVCAYEIATNSSVMMTGNVIVTSKYRNQDSREIIDITGGLSESTFNLSATNAIVLYVLLQRNNEPIIFANVLAVVEDAQGETTHLELNDKGIGTVY